MSELKVKQSVIKFHVFEEFPMEEILKIDEAMRNLGYKGNLIDNGNITYKKDEM